MTHFAMTLSQYGWGLGCVGAGGLLAVVSSLDEGAKLAVLLACVAAGAVLYIVGGATL